MNRLQLSIVRFLVITCLISVAATAATAAAAAAATDNNDVEDSRRENDSDRCVSGWQCDTTNECSVMGMQRYSEPECRPRGDVGHPCIPFAKPSNKTLHYPHTTKRCEQVYMMYCPCALDLVCDIQDNTCKRASLKRHENPWSMARLH